MFGSCACCNMIANNDNVNDALASITDVIIGMVTSLGFNLYLNAICTALEQTNNIDASCNAKKKDCKRVR